MNKERETQVEPKGQIVEGGRVIKIRTKGEDGKPVVAVIETGENGEPGRVISVMKIDKPRGNR